jgi:hypothetical protein
MSYMCMYVYAYLFWKPLVEIVANLEKHCGSQFVTAYLV